MPAPARLTLRQRLRGMPRARLWALAGGLSLAALLVSAVRVSALDGDDDQRVRTRSAATQGTLAANARTGEPDVRTPVRGEERAAAQARAEGPLPASSAASSAQAQRRIWLQGALAALALLLLCGVYDASRQPRRGAHGPSGAPSDDARAAPLPQAAAGSRRETDMLALAGSRMRQPLHAMSLFAGSLNRDALPAQRKALQGLEASVREMAGVIEEVEEISRLLRREVPVSVADLPVAGLFDALKPEVERRAQARGVDVHWHPGSLHLYSDPALAGRLLRVLVDQAVDRARRRVLIAARPATERVRVQVRDDGAAVGASAAAIPLEELLRRANDTDDRGDAGLELTLGAGIAELLALKVDLHTAPERGNTLAIDFPRASPAHATTQPDDATLLSLALLDSEARQGRLTPSRLSPAAPTSQGGGAYPERGNVEPSPMRVAPTPDGDSASGR